MMKKTKATQYLAVGVLLLVAVNIYCVFIVVARNSQAATFESFLNDDNSVQRLEGSDSSLDAEKITTTTEKPINELTEMFEPVAIGDFPATDKVTIPHIIHQTYKDLNIPEQFIPYIETFYKFNKKWTYYFWTDDSARKLIAKRHPWFLSVWDNYSKNINRADALRYFILYEFGGIYADLDVECLRPLDRAFMKYSCIIPAEPPEHGFRHHAPYILTNAIMMCRPKHPFFKQLIHNLGNFQSLVEQIDTAGPTFVTSQFMIYNHFKPGDRFRQKTSFDSNSPFFYKGDLSEDDKNAVYVPNSHYFMHTLNWVKIDKNYYSSFCKENRRTNDSIIVRGCNHYRHRSKIKEPNKFTFTEHHWVQTYINTKKRFPTFKHLNTAIKVYKIF